jgi:transposase-like protein
MSSSQKGGREPIYEHSLKVAVAREYLTSQLGYGKLAQKHGLSLATVRFFVRWYKANYPDVESPAVTSSVETEAGCSPTELELLRKQLQQANLKVAAWEMLLENAGKELGVDIVKKFGAKPSGK